MQGVRPPGNGCALEIRWGTRTNCDVGYSGPIYDNDLVRGHAWRNHCCKGFVHARPRFQGKEPCETRERVLWLQRGGRLVRHAGTVRHPALAVSRGSEETVRNRGVLRPVNGIPDVVGGVLPVESTNQTVRTNGNGPRTGVPPWKTGERRGPRD